MVALAFVCAARVLVCSARNLWLASRRYTGPRRGLLSATAAYVLRVATPLLLIGGVRWRSTSEVKVADGMEMDRARASRPAE